MRPMKGKDRYLLGVILVIMGILLCGCQVKRRSGKGAVTPAPSAASESAADMTGIVRSIDTIGKTLTVQNIATDQELMLLYTGATSFVSANEKELAPSQIAVGEAVDIYSENKTVKKVQISSEVETRENVTGLVVNSRESYVEMGTAKYRYTKGVVVVSEKKLIDMMEVTALDVLTVKYVEGRIYSIQITNGHGYIRPKNYKDFVGGTMTVDGQTILPVSDKMLVAVPEGTYQVTMKNGDFTGSQKTTVERDQESVLDMSLFKSQPENTGQVDFDINPSGAELYVNGTQVSYKNPVSLKYGEHSVVVRLEGYSDYEGTLDVQSANPTVKIDLAEEEAEVDRNDNSTVTNSTSTSENTASTTDSEHKITVSEPAGASVYLNGTYKGVAPCSFTKVIGSQTITLSQSGYTTKSYTVTIANDGEDILWNFPALTK